MKNQRMIVKKSIISFCCLCVVALIIVCFLTKGSKAEDSNPTVITHGYATSDDLVPPEEGTKGSTKNPCVVLEMVPDMKYAQIGYMISGCEPVDIDKIIEDAKNGSTVAERFLGDICAAGAATYTSSTREVSKFDLDKTDNTAMWDYVNWRKMSQTGYYERVEDGTGLIEQVVTSKNANGTIKSANYIRKNDGNFVWVPYTDTMPATNHNATKVGDRVYTTREDYYYINYNYKEYIYTHNDTYLRSVLGVPEDKCDDYNVVVKTVTPSELNAHPEWAQRADLVFITNKSYRNTLSEVYKTYSKIPYHDNGNSDDKMNYSNDNDLNWDTAMKLFHKIVLDQEEAGVIIDQTVFTEMLNSGTMKNVTEGQIGMDGSILPKSNSTCSASNNNVFKLCLMLNTMNPQALYNMYLRDYEDGTRSASIQEGKRTDGQTTGVFGVQSGDAKQYWGVKTFMPAKLDGTPSNEADCATGECHSTYETKMSLQYDNGTVNSHVYLFPSNMSILDTLTNSNGIKADSLNKELFQFLYEENNYTGTSTSPAMAIQFIMGLPEDKKKVKESIHVLDLEPCTISSEIACSKSYLTEVILRTKLVPLYTGDVTIDHQSTATFNGKKDDLNCTYDLIYMGMYYGRFNMSNNRTVYNDSSLNGKIYLHVGDKVLSREELYYRVNWPTNMDNIARGPGNDITSSRKDDLKDYLKAGYPIVVDKDLYNKSTEYIDSSSYIYKFISESRSNLLDETNTATGGTVLDTLKESGLILHMKEGDFPKEYVGDTTSGSIDANEYVSRDLLYQFTLEDSTYEAGDTYTAKLYVDTSRDGIFSADEINDTKTGLKADGTKYSLQKTLSKKFVGAVPWKVVVTKDSNTSMRDTMEGISAIKGSITEKKVINVLQVTDSTRSTLNLQENVASMGLFYKYTTNLNDYTIDFTTIDINTFESWYTASDTFNKNASNEQKTATDKLSDYNMVILGLADGYSNISNKYGALDNIQFYIDSGKSVLFTHDVTSLYNIADAGNKDSNALSGYNFNTLFRDYLGMDRFGVRTTDTSEKNSKDKATKPGSGEYKQIHGYTYQALTKLGDSATNSYPLYSGAKFTEATPVTTKVERLNKGQITSYPYAIDLSVTIAPTHAQYYELELDDEDLNVWYTLEQSDSEDNGYFSCSANDASNNYYIYNKGNITYSGVGHSDISNNDREVKLFINTIIAAYGNGNESPNVEVVNTGVYKNSKNEYSLYVSVDYAETTFDNDNYEDVSFVPHNNSLITDLLYVKAATKDGALMSIYDDSGHKIALDSNGYAKLTDGELYHLKWAQSNLPNVDKRDIYFSTYYIDSKNKTRSGLTKAHLLRRNLFDLE